MSKDNNNDSKTLLILVVLFLLGGLYLLFGSNFKPTKQISHSSLDTEQNGGVNWDRLNEKMRLLEGQKKIKQMQQEAQNAKLSRDLEFSDIRDRAEPASELHLDMLPEESSKQVYSDLDHTQYLPDSRRPRDVINAQKELDQILNNLDKQHRDEFVKQFVENARQGGWQVKLSDELKVIEVRPIRKKRGYPSRVPQSSPHRGESSSGGIN